VRPHGSGRACCVFRITAREWRFRPEQ
jgi:hypothetical protein